MAIEVLASGYTLIEAPRVDEIDRLYFSNVRESGGVYRRSPDGAIETLIPKRKGVGGMALDEAGGFVAGGRGLLYWSERTRQSRNIFTEFEGRPLRGLNDLTPDGHGGVYVGSLEFDDSGPERIPCNLFRVDPDGTATKLWEGIELTNGMGLSPDGKLLYHCDTATEAVWVYDVAPDRSVKDRRIFAKVEGWPDGMAVDAEGGVFVAMAHGGEVVRIRSDGTIERRIKIPQSFVTSVTFGGRDMQDLYVVTARDKNATGTIYRMRSDIPGLPVPRTRFGEKVATA
jgi:sugar lactone lactonase YvrE